MGAGSKLESTRYFNDYKPTPAVLKTKETSRGANLHCCRCGKELEESIETQKQYHHKLGKKVFHIGKCSDYE
jgi:hypothetical protein